PPLRSYRLLGRYCTLPQQPRADRRRDRGHRPHPTQLRPDHSYGRLHGQGDWAPSRIGPAMNDTGKEQKTVPAEEVAAANNNLEETAEERAAAEAEELSPEARAAALEAGLIEHKDRLLRALAETENVRRRSQREREDAAKYAVASFAKELLSVADNL